MERLPLFDQIFSEKFLVPHIQQIAEVVRSRVEQTTQPGWMTGLAGMAIFLAEYEHGMSPAPEPDQDSAGRILHKIVEEINNGFAYPTMAAGLAGIVWAFHYLGARGFASSADAAALDELLPFIRRFTHHAFKENNTDSLHGATGPFITGLLKPDDLPADWQGAMTWPFPREDVDLGLAHGLPSWLLFLEAVDDPRFDEGLEKFLSFGADSQKSSFPTRIKKGQPEFPSRLAWCYGDVGIGMSLLRLKHRDRCWEIGLEVLEKAAQRRDPEETRVKDPYFCHGSSGLAFMFYKAWVLSKNDKLKEAAQFWTKGTIRMLETSHPAGKDYQLSGVNFGDASLLNGLSGIGLSLLSMTLSVRDGWESGLMI